MKNNFTKNLLKNLNLDIETADVNFILDILDPRSCTTIEKKLPVHKAILAGGSLVFRSMFYGALKETNDVRITDYSYEGFREFINLFYLADVTLSKENILEVIQAVDKYDTRECLHSCETFLAATINKDNVCDVQDIATKINLSKSLIERAAVVITENTMNVFQSDGFRFCGRSVLKTILQMQELNCANELTVFKAVMDWTDNCCRQKDLALTDINRRFELGELFGLIRFTAMTASEFLQLQERHPELFDYKEFAEVLQHKLRAKPLKIFASFNSTGRIFRPQFRFLSNTEMLSKNVFK